MCWPNLPELVKSTPPKVLFVSRCVVENGVIISLSAGAQAREIKSCGPEKGPTTTTRPANPEKGTYQKV